MAFVEKRGKNSWRVRYPNGDRGFHTIAGFTSEKAAKDAIDVADATASQYRSLTRNHILPRWGTSSLDAITGLAVHTWAKKLRGEGYAVSTVSTITKIMSMLLADAATTPAPNDSGRPPTKPYRSPCRPPRSSGTGPPS